MFLLLRFFSNPFPKPFDPPARRHRCFPSFFRLFYRTSSGPSSVCPSSVRRGGAFRRSCIVPSPCPAGMLSLRNSSGEEFLGFVLMRFAELILKIACVSYPIHYPTAFSTENRRWMYPPISTQKDTGISLCRTMKTNRTSAVIRGRNRCLRRHDTCYGNIT